MEKGESQLTLGLGFCQLSTMRGEQVEDAEGLHRM